MRRPFVVIIPSRRRHLILLSILFLITRSFRNRGRFLLTKMLTKRSVRSLPGFVPVCIRGLAPLLRRILLLVSLSLLPFRSVGLHFPLLGVGISLSIWMSIIRTRRRTRSFQLKKELLRDNSLSWVWVIFSVGIERIRRVTRALTLGARIRVNIIMGGILHRVIGGLPSRWGGIGLCLLEIIVVIIQTYVLILLICLYRAELE